MRGLIAAMGSLKASLIRQIQQGGPMDIGRFMQACLCDPQYGYYMVRDPFGAAGDFTTAPEISQMFGEVLGLCLADYWMRIGAPADFALVECGAGRGTLMADILRATRVVPGFHEALHLCFLEVSPVLRQQQEEAVSAFDLAHGVCFLNQIEDAADEMPVLVIGNEFLDALPVRQFEKHQGTWKERVVGVNDGATALSYGVVQAALDPMAIIPMGLQMVPEGNVYEFSPVRSDFVRRVCDVLSARGGGALFIDYGESQSKAGNSLHAIADHKHVDVLDDPGTCDLSANVDFEVLARDVEANGGDVCGIVEQGDFLRALGIEQRFALLAQKASEQQREDLEKGLHRLIDSDQMGSLFKVFGFCYGSSERFAGF